MPVNEFSNLDKIVIHIHDRILERSKSERANVAFQPGTRLHIKLKMCPASLRLPLGTLQVLPGNED